MSLTYKDISEILKIIDSSSCEELVLEVGDTKLVVQRNGGGHPVTNIGAITETTAPQMQNPQNLPLLATTLRPMQPALQASKFARPWSELFTKNRHRLSRLSSRKVKQLRKAIRSA